MKNYGHSKVFDLMKRTKESIDTNFTSLQYLQTLDFFIWKAIEPIAQECPSFLKNYLSKVVCRQTLKPSNKFTSDDKDLLPVALFNVLCSDQKDLIKNARLLYLNRGLLFGLVTLFEDSLKLYQELNEGKYNIDLDQRRVLIRRIETDFGLEVDSNLYIAVRQVRYWHDKARHFKSKIVEKYTRMAILQAQSTYKDFNHLTDLDDVVQIYLMVVNQAIDRCDARQGVLTTFIQNWFKSARSKVSKMCETRNEVSYDSLVEDHGDGSHLIIGVTMPNQSKEFYEHVSFIANQFDPVGLVRASLGIPQYVSKKHKALLEQFLIE